MCIYIIPFLHTNPKRRSQITLLPTDKLAKKTLLKSDNLKVVMCRNMVFDMAPSKTCYMNGVLEIFSAR